MTAARFKTEGCGARISGFTECGRNGYFCSDECTEKALKERHVEKCPMRENLSAECLCP